MSLIPGVRIDPRLRIDPWIGFTPDVSSGLLKCTRSGTTAKLLRLMDKLLGSVTVYWENDIAAEKALKINKKPN